MAGEQNVYARHRYQRVHPARAAGSGHEAPEAGDGVPGDRIVVPAITWAGISLAARESGPAAQQLADAFAARLGAILPWDRAAVDATTEIKVALRLAGTPIGLNDMAIAGHVLAAGAVLVTGRGGEFERVPGLQPEDWVN